MVYLLDNAKRAALHKLIVQHKSYDDMEETHRLVVKHMLETVEPIFDRRCYERLDNVELNGPGHMTAGAIVVNKTYTRTLVQKHKYLSKYMWAGGHADGETVPAFISHKEFTEEVGDLPIELADELFDIDVHQVPANDAKKEPKHLHFDFRCLYFADDTVPLPVSPEGIESKWITLDEGRKMFPAGGGRRRCIEKLSAISEIMGSR